MSESHVPNLIESTEESNLWEWLIKGAVNITVSAFFMYVFVKYIICEIQIKKQRRERNISKEIIISNLTLF